MWFKLLLCILVAFAYADHNPGWKHNHQYVYLVRGRTLASLNQISNHYSGIILKAKLTIRPTSDGHLGAKISNGQYANFNDKLEDRWEEEIPESQLNYKELPLPSGPFKIVMSNNVAKNLVVDQTTPNWQVNMMKGIVSQLQLDVDAENRIRSSINQFTQDANNAVFKTMEKTVTGESETLYEIKPLPEYTLQSEPWLGPLKELKEDGVFIEVVKNKNYTHSKKTPAYHFGLEGIDDFNINNKIGDFFSRTSMSRAVLSGNLDDFTIQSSVTFDQVTMNPTLQDKQRGSTNSIVNITLSQMEQQDQEFEEVSNPVSVGLFYSYNHPFAESNEPRERKLSSPESGESSSSQSSEDNYGKSRQNRDVHLSSSETGTTAEREQFPVQEKPHIDEAPAAPLLPFTVGYDGQAISKKQNIMENVRTLAKQIGQEVQQPDEIPQKNSAGKFLILSSLVRVMNANEIKQVSAQLYNKDQHSPLGAAWNALRDAVAQAGTGPALLNIEDWIRKGKIASEEAAAVVATASESARQPTEKYMKVFFGMIEDEQIMQQQYLNQSLLLSFTKLVHQVYFSKDQSHNKFPVYSFGSFNTEQGRMFVKSQVIPFLSQQLEEAVAEADTERIHVYIRALGNVGHPEILQTFKPYLEGTKKMSQFQRVLVVISLDNLANSHPKQARSVLYKIYQNPRDYEQVRVAAVYQLMRTKPSPSMLQRMAVYTNIDTNNHVNAAVKSVIESIAEHQLPQFSQLREAAKSAKELLNSQDFGVQHSQSYLRTFVMDEIASEQSAETYGGEDSVMPRGINAWLVRRLGGVKQQLINLQAVVSSVEDLINVFEQQTKPYRRLLKEKQSYKSVNTKWSSENTAKLLNMQNEQREQLEGYILLQIDALQKIWSFDNQTIENYTEVVQELERELRNGKHFDFNKMTVDPEMALSFPTAWGLPFIYTYDRPTLVHLESDLKVVAEPPVAVPEGLQKPEKINIQYKMNGYVSGRVQSQLGFFAPFNHKRYSAGYDKNLQVRIPKIVGKVDVDVNNKQATLEIERSGKQNVNLLHFSTWPYTSQREIYDLQSQSEIIRSENPYRVNTLFGEKSSGIAFSLQMTSDKPIDYAFMYELLDDKNPASPSVSSWLDENIEHVQIDLEVNGDKSTTNKMIIHLGHQQKYTSGSSDNGGSKNPHKYPVNQESWERQKEFLKNSSKGIKNANAQVVDAVVLFEGQRIIKYTATLAGGKSNIDPKSRILMQVEKDNQQDQPLKVSFSAEGKIPNTNSLDLNHALDSDFTTSVEAKAEIGNKNGNPSQFDIKVKLWKSEERKQYLKDQPQYKGCQKQMQEGNNQLPTCAILTAQANLLDQFSVQVDYQNVGPTVANMTYKAYSLLRQYLYPRVSENIMVEDQSKPNSLSIEGQFDPALSRANVSISTRHVRAEIKNVEINPLARTLLVHHPLYHAKTRIFGHALSYDTYRPICVVDKTAANTFDNKTYPINLDKDWVVLLHYVPRRPSPIKNQPELSVTDQLNQQIEGYIIYGRASDNDNSQKEIKMVIQAPSTLGKVIDITLKPTDSSSYPRLYIQNEKILYDDDGSHIFDGYMQVYKLPNNELKAEVYDSFSIVYDGVRAKISILNDKFRDAARGLCGTFTGEPETDFTHPGNCIIHDPEVFVATNTVPEKQRTKRMNDMMMIQAEEKKCYQKTVRFVKVVSAEDSGLTSYNRKLMRSNNMLLQTKYIASADKICFTISPVPVCKRGYRENSIAKSVKVQCLKPSTVTELWKRQIDQGQSPSFANKRHNKHMMVRMAQSCE